MWRFHELVKHPPQYLARSKHSKNNSNSSNSKVQNMVFAFKEALSRDSFQLPAQYGASVTGHVWKPRLLTHGPAPFPWHHSSALGGLSPPFTSQWLQRIYIVNKTEHGPKVVSHKKYDVYNLLLNIHWKRSPLVWRLEQLPKISINSEPLPISCFQRTSSHRDGHFQSCWAAVETLMKLQPFLWQFLAKVLHRTPDGSEPWHHSPAQRDPWTKWSVINQKG